MPEIPLNDPNIGSFVDQRVPATVPQHMRMNIQMLQAGRPSDLVDHQPHRDTRQRLAPLTDEERVAILRGIHLCSFDQPGFNGQRL